MTEDSFSQMSLAIRHPRPRWMRDGVVVAGNWSSWMARKQRIGANWTQMGHALSDEEAEASYRREMAPEMADRLRELGATLVIMPLWSGMGSYEDELPGTQEPECALTKWEQTT